MIAAIICGAAASAAAWFVVQFYLPYLLAQNAAATEISGKKVFKFAAPALSFLSCFLCVLVLTEYREPPDFSAWMRILFSLLILQTISITDSACFRIPNLCSLLLCGAAVFCIGLGFAADGKDYIYSALSHVLAGGAALLFFFLLNRITRGGIGEGDVKLFAALGLLCGGGMLAYTVVFSFFVCAPVSAILLIFKKKSKRDSLPFGPFIWIGFVLSVVLFA